MNVFPTTCLLVCAWWAVASGEPLTIAEPSHDRWMYPANSTPGYRPQASTFSALPASGGLDDRWGFFLLAFDTGGKIPTGLPKEYYNIRSVKVTATVGQDLFFRYDPSYDPWRTYATPSVAASVTDVDPGRPVELHGAGFRNGFTAATFLETSNYGGNGSPGTRNAFPMGFNASGSGRDVSSNISQQFESVPWACAAADLTPGALVPEGTVLRFDLNTALPGVTNYLREGLSAGRMWFAINSLHPATQQAGEFVSVYTKDDIYHELFGGIAPTLEIDFVLQYPLTIARQGGLMELTWPAFAGHSYTVQASTTLAEGSWDDLHTEEFDSDGNGEYLTTYVPGPRFFRLIITPSDP